MGFRLEIQVCDLFWGFLFMIRGWNSGLVFRFGGQVLDSVSRFRFGIQVSDSDFIFRFWIQIWD